jgi:LruC domain-containing protein
MIKRIFFLLLTILSMFIISCTSNDDIGENGNNTEFENLSVSDDFMFSTLHNVEIDLSVSNGNNSGVANISFDFYNADPSEGGKLLYSGATGENGEFHTLVPLPTALETVYVVGFMTTMELPIANSRITYHFGESVSRNLSIQDAVTPPKSTLEYVLPYTSNGTPIGMTSDNIPTGLLTKINATLPERQPLPQYHPDYLAEGNQLNVVLINEPADVWVTFVHEGAGHYNCLGYYTYQQGNAPMSTSDIDLIKVIFPNVSMVNSGGGLVPGDKVYLGQFQPGTVIGWVLMDNGWSHGSSHIVTDTWYSNFLVSHHQTQQSILVYDDEYEKLLFAFEDLEYPYGDNDFNDAIFYATVNPINAVDINDVPPIDEPGDRDGDGISDIFDDFPDDPNRAFETNDHSFSTLAFEDLWPHKGDYDFNDMVLDYNFFYHTKPNSIVTHIIAEFKLMAVGARLQNGFAVQLPFTSDKIENITVIDGGDTLTYSDIISDANFNPALETGNQAVIVFIQNTNDLMPQSSSDFINTEAGSPYITPVEFAVDIKLNTTSETPSNWQWQPPFNPFIYVDRTRSHEIHLPDMPPTPQADFSLFMTDDDDTIVTNNRYYRTATNLPWAINIAESWDHPYERKQITEAYLKFKPWAESSGSIYPDWFLDSPGYRDDTKIYMIP